MTPAIAGNVHFPIQITALLANGKSVSIEKAFRFYVPVD